MNRYYKIAVVWLCIQYRGIAILYNKSKCSLPKGLKQLFLNVFKIKFQKAPLLIAAQSMGTLCVCVCVFYVIDI